MKDDSIFGVESGRLKKLAALGLGQDEAAQDQRAGATAASGLFVEGSGDWIGHYRLIRVLGEGGMGIVYLAEQRRPIKRQVALKLVKPGMDSKKIIARFEAEQQALACMDHPHVARVFDAGLTGAGRPYFVMEYVEGIPITEHCDKHSLTLEARLELFIHVCEAIQHAHYKGIIHRDLKPSNILVSIIDNQAVSKIIDFGIAKALTQSLTDRTLYTEQGQFIGTPEYMSPEQAEQSPQGIDTRTDVYSLGVVLYELLTGVLPFDAETFRTGGPEHIRRMIRDTDPPRPSTRLRQTGSTSGESSHLATRHSSLATELDWITLKAMEKDPDRRYATAQALADDIQRHLNHEPVTAGSPSLRYRVSKFLRRNRTRVAAVGGVVVLLGCIVALTLTSSRASRQAQMAAILRDRETLQAAQEAFYKNRLDDALERIVPVLTSDSVGPQARLLQGSIFFEGGHAQEAVEKLETLLEEAPEIAGSAHALLARIYWESGDGQGDSVALASYHSQKAEELLPETAEAFYLRALMALTVKDTLELLEKALYEDSQHYASLRLHAHTLGAAEHFGPMEADAGALISARPGDSFGYILRATARFEQGKYGSALLDIDHVLNRMSLEADRHEALLDLQGRCLLALGRHQDVVANADVAIETFPDANTPAFHKFAALLAVGDYDEAAAMFYQSCLLAPPRHRDFLNWGIKYVFDTQAAGQAWHLPEKRPEGLPFIHLHEAEENYRALAAKGRRLIDKGFSPQWSPDGSQLAYSLGVVGVSGVAVYDMETQQSDLLIVPGKDPRWSPDGEHLVFVRGRRALDIGRLRQVERRRLPPDRKYEKVWIMRSDGSEARRLAQGGWPFWSEDGERVFYHSRTDNALYEIDVSDRAAEPRRIRTITNQWPSVSPDGKQVAWIRDDNQLCIWDSGSPSMAPTHIHDLPGLRVWGGLWSPDSRFFGFGSSGPIIRAGLWLYDLQENRVRKVLSGNGLSPHWSSDGRLAFTLDQPMFEIWAADVASLGPGQTLAEHDREMIARYTRRIDCESGPATDAGIDLTALAGSDITGITVSKPGLHLLRADCYVRLNELDKAIADIEQAARISGEPEKTARRLAELKAAQAEGREISHRAAEGRLSYDRASAVYSVVGSGSDIWDQSDEFHYAHATLEGDGSITAKIESVEYIEYWTKAGLMIRSTLDTASPNGYILLTPSGVVAFQSRSREWGGTQSEFSGATIELPHWVRLTRRGNWFTPEHSKDGVQWEPVAVPQAPDARSSFEIPMHDRVSIGLAVTSHNTVRSAEARFSNVTLTGAETPNGILTASRDIRLKSKGLQKGE